MNQELTIGAKVAELRDWLQDKQEKLFFGARAGYNEDETIDAVMKAYYKNPVLFTCDNASAYLAIKEAITLNLKIGGVLGQCYLVPYRGKVELLAGYLGYKELAFRSGMIKDFSAEIVRFGDEFEWEYGTDKFLRHKPKLDNDGIIEYVYAMGRTTTGGCEFVVMSVSQIEEHKQQYSKGFDKPRSAWKTAWEAMAKKTCFRRIVKLLPVSTELLQLAQREEYIEKEVIVDSLPEGSPVPIEDLEDLTTQLVEENTESEKATDGKLF